jgi:aminomethyltransferase
VVKLDKPGDFVGKEALREIAAKGTARLLSGLRISGEELPEAEAPVLHEGNEVGRRAQPRARARRSTWK